MADLQAHIYSNAILPLLKQWRLEKIKGRPSVQVLQRAVPLEAVGCQSFILRVADVALKYGLRPVVLDEPHAELLSLCGQYTRRIYNGGRILDFLRERGLTSASVETAYRVASAILINSYHGFEPGAFFRILILSKLADPMQSKIRRLWETKYVPPLRAPSVGRTPVVLPQRRSARLARSNNFAISKGSVDFVARAFRQDALEWLAECEQLDSEHAPFTLSSSKSDSSEYENRSDDAAYLLEEALVPDQLMKASTAPPGNSTQIQSEDVVRSLKYNITLDPFSDREALVFLVALKDAVERGAEVAGPRNRGRQIMRWSDIVDVLPGRTTRDCKEFYYANKDIVRLRRKSTDAS